MKMPELYLEEWSRDYFMVGNTEVRSWDEGEAHMDAGLYDFLASYVGEPVVGLVDGAHYQFKRSREVMAHECVIPEFSPGSGRPTLLVQK
jgi:hypothetical protein